MELGKYLNPVIDVTWVQRASIKPMCIGAGTVFVLATVIAAYLRFIRGMDSGEVGFIVACAPLVALLVSGKVFWNPV